MPPFKRRPFLFFGPINEIIPIPSKGGSVGKCWKE